MDKTEQRKGIFCGIMKLLPLTFLSPANYTSWSDLIEAIDQIHKTTEQPSAADYQATEMLLFLKSQVSSKSIDSKQSLKQRQPYTQPVGTRI